MLRTVISLQIYSGAGIDECEWAKRINVYDPPESDRHFFKSLFTTIASESERIVIRAGNFNVILHDKVDTSIKNNKTHLAHLLTCLLRWSFLPLNQSAE